MANKLTLEKSPYLLQHAENPVNWYPWGSEAFERAKAEDKPIILSIGYSTCHWCHVMEHESFSDEITAKVMNDHFISIKVDREERPDIDSLYMSYVIATTGSGGWPMTVFLTPERKPFFGGTYFPPDDRYGMPGFKTLMASIVDAWKTRRGEISDSAESAVTYLANHQGSSEKVALSADILHKAAAYYAQMFDTVHGGFGRAPKFPMGHTLSYLLRYWRRSGDSSALEMTEKTLSVMAFGGIYDQIGGGFHRYSTDQEWRLPHFEKMLYDQALLSRAYLEAYQATAKTAYADTVNGIFEYVKREMTSPEGAFYSAQDADSADPEDVSHKKEGAFFVWKKSEVEKLLPEKDANIFCFYYGVLPDGNVLHDPHQEFTGKNLIAVTHLAEETANHFGVTAPQIEESLVRSRKTLFAAREKRPRPHLDDKILTDWNALMISSFALASRALNKPEYAETARRAAEFLFRNMTDGKGRLFHRYRAGTAGIAGHLDDYAFLAEACLHVYEATFDVVWLERVRDLSLKLIELFWDKDKKGFFITSAEESTLIVRPKPDHDGAIPSGSAAAVITLLKLHRITGEDTFERHARETFEAYSFAIDNQPTGFAYLLSAFDFAIGPSHEIVIAWNSKQSPLEPFTREIYGRFLPNKVVLLKTSGAALERLAPFTKEQNSLNGEVTVYVCKNHACELPVTDASKLKSLLETKGNSN